MTWNIWSEYFWIRFSRIDLIKCWKNNKNKVTNPGFYPQNSLLFTKVAENGMNNTKFSVLCFIYCDIGVYQP